MKMVRRQQDVEKTPEESTPEVAGRDGEALLIDRGLLAPWAGLWCLGHELARAKRYGSPLTIAVLMPLRRVEEEIVPPGIYTSALALKSLARKADILAWLGSTHILAILPCTDGTEAEGAVQRWCSEMLRRSMSVDAVKWVAGVVSNPCDFDGVEEVLAEGTQRAVRAVGSISNC